MKRLFHQPKTSIVDQVRDWDDLVVIGTKNGQQQFLSSADEPQTQKLLEGATAFEGASG